MESISGFNSWIIADKLSDHCESTFHCRLDFRGTWNELTPTRTNDFEWQETWKGKMQFPLIWCWKNKKHFDWPWCILCQIFPWHFSMLGHAQEPLYNRRPSELQPKLHSQNPCHTIPGTQITSSNWGVWLRKLLQCMTRDAKHRLFSTCTRCMDMLSRMKEYRWC